MATGLACRSFEQLLLDADPTMTINANANDDVSDQDGTDDPLERHAENEAVRCLQTIFDDFHRLLWTEDQEQPTTKAPPTTAEENT